MTRRCGLWCGGSLVPRLGGAACGVVRVWHFDTAWGADFIGCRTFLSVLILPDVAYPKCVIVPSEAYCHIS